VDIKHTKSARR